MAGQARQRVRPAVQLLSATSALALERYLGRTEAAEFVKTVDEGFDVLNAGHPDDVKPHRRGYRGSPEQEAALTALQREVEGLRVGDARHLLPFQRGLLVDIRSVRGLLADLKGSIGPQTYIMTRRLTQDRLEATFGLIRVGGGANTNPTPIDAASRLTLLSLLMLTRHGVNALAGAEDADTEMADVSSADQDDALDDLFCEFDQPDFAGRPLAGTSGGAGQPRAGASALPLAGASGGAGRAFPGADLRTGVTAEASAMAYVAGYVARNATSLGKPSSQTEDEPIEALWTRLRSIGGLTMPTAQFLQEFAAMNENFKDYHARHNDQLSREPGVIRRLVQALLKKHPRVPTKVVRRFARTRTFIRLRRTNRKRKEAAQQRREKRKRKSFAN